MAILLATLMATGSYGFVISEQPDRHGSKNRSDIITIDDQLTDNLKDLSIDSSTDRFPNRSAISSSTLPELLIETLLEVITDSASTGYAEVAAVQNGDKFHDDGVKCLTPYLLLYDEYHDRIDPEIRRKIDELLQFDLQTAEMIESPSGRFRLYFYRDGDNAVPPDDSNNSGIPDYVENAAEYADESWDIQVDELGFEDPVADESLAIWIQYTGPQTYGYTVVDGETIRIVVHNTFFNFPPNDDPDGHQLGALKVTIAHELKHAIQFATNRWRGNAGSFNWVEMDATMMENIVYPQVNDYYNYIGGTNGIFGNPRRSTPVAYSHVTWMLFYAEFLGMSYWVDTWREIRDDHIVLMVNAMKQAFPSGLVTSEAAMSKTAPLEAASAETNPFTPAGITFIESREKLFVELFARNNLWHATSGSRTIPGYGFIESHAYPDAIMEQSHDFVPEDYRDTGQLERMSGTYRMFSPGPGQIGPVSISASHDHDHLAVGLLGYRRDGTFAEWIVTTGAGGINSVNGTFEATSPFSAVELDSFIVTIVNANSEEPITYTLEMEIISIPEVATLEPNYPNPFSGTSGQPGTTITFSVPESERVTLIVYDITGREVDRMFDRVVEPGRYSVPFSAEGLASGVYIYRMRAGNVQETGKMTLIR